MQERRERGVGKRVVRWGGPGLPFVSRPWSLPQTS